jgi:hypothetical protein
LPRPRKPFQKPEVPVERFVRTLLGVNARSIKMDLERHNLLRRTKNTMRWRVRKSTAKRFFEERIWDHTGKMDIFPTEAGKAKLRELYEAGELTLKAGYQAPQKSS